LACFPLGIEGREGKIEIMLARFAGIDGAAREFLHGIVHGFAFGVASFRPPRQADAVIRYDS
jgi:hypothetical protein